MTVAALEETGVQLVVLGSIEKPKDHHNYSIEHPPTANGMDNAELRDNVTKFESNPKIDWMKGVCSDRGAESVIIVDIPAGLTTNRPGDVVKLRGEIAAKIAEAKTGKLGKPVAFALCMDVDSGIKPQPCDQERIRLSDRDRTSDSQRGADNRMANSIQKIQDLGLEDLLEELGVPLNQALLLSAENQNVTSENVDYAVVKVQYGIGDEAKASYVVGPGQIIDPVTRDISEALGYQVSTTDVAMALGFYDQLAKQMFTRNPKRYGVGEGVKVTPEIEEMAIKEIKEAISKDPMSVMCLEDERTGATVNRARTLLDAVAQLDQEDQQRSFAGLINAVQREQHIDNEPPIAYSLTPAFIASRNTTLVSQPELLVFSALPDEVRRDALKNIAEREPHPQNVEAIADGIKEYVNSHENLKKVAQEEDLSTYLATEKLDAAILGNQFTGFKDDRIKRRRALMDASERLKSGDAESIHDLSHEAKDALAACGIHTATSARPRTPEEFQRDELYDNIQANIVKALAGKPGFGTDIKLKSEPMAEHQKRLLDDDYNAGRISKRQKQEKTAEIEYKLTSARIGKAMFDAINALCEIHADVDIQNGTAIYNNLVITADNEAAAIRLHSLFEYLTEKNDKSRSPTVMQVKEKDGAFSFSVSHIDEHVLRGLRRDMNIMRQAYLEQEFPGWSVRTHEDKNTFAKRKEKETWPPEVVMEEEEAIIAHQRLKGKVTATYTDRIREMEQQKGIVPPPEESYERLIGFYAANGPDSYPEVCIEVKDDSMVAFEAISDLFSAPIKRATKAMGRDHRTNLEQAEGEPDGLTTDRGSDLQRGQATDDGSIANTTKVPFWTAVKSYVTHHAEEIGAKVWEFSKPFVSFDPMGIAENVYKLGNTNPILEKGNEFLKMQDANRDRIKQETQRVIKLGERAKREQMQEEALAACEPMLAIQTAPSPHAYVILGSRSVPGTSRILR